MAKLTNQEWYAFRKSQAFHFLDAYRPNELKHALNLLIEMMANYGAGNWGTLTVAQSEQVLINLADMARQGGGNDDFRVLIQSYDMLHAWLTYLVESHRVTFAAPALTKMLSQFEREQGLAGDDGDSLERIAAVKQANSLLEQAEPSGGDVYIEAEIHGLENRNIDEDPSLPQWQWYTAAEIKRYIGEWLAAYLASPSWRKNAAPLSKNELTEVVTLIADSGYDLYRKTPKTWNKRMLVADFAGPLADELDWPITQLNQIGPAVCDFIGYVAEQGWLNEKKAANYQRYLGKAQTALTEWLADEEAMSDQDDELTKLVMRMTDEGVDVNDDRAVQKYLAKLVQDDPSALEGLGDSAEAYGLPANLADMIKDPQQLAILAEMFDPNPNFLAHEHQTTGSNGKWQRKIAEKLHQQAVEESLKLWAQREAYDLPADWEDVEVLSFTSSFIDVMYSQNLATPAQLTPSMLRRFGDWLRQDDEADVKIGILTAYLSILSADKLISAKQAGPLIAALRGETDSRAAAGGQVISLKDASKRLNGKGKRRNKK